MRPSTCWERGCTCNKTPQPPVPCRVTLGPFQDGLFYLCGFFPPKFIKVAQRVTSLGPPGGAKNCDGRKLQMAEFSHD